MSKVYVYNQVKAKSCRPFTRQRDSALHQVVAYRRLPHYQRASQSTHPPRQQALRASKHDCQNSTSTNYSTTYGLHTLGCCALRLHHTMQSPDKHRHLFYPPLHNHTVGFSKATVTRFSAFFFLLSSRRRWYTAARIATATTAIPAPTPAPMVAPSGPLLDACTSPYQHSASLSL